MTSSPAGISCGSDCSESYASGTSVTLTASAAGGSTFAGWSGACSGTGTCNVTMTAARSVTATFNTSGGGARDLRQQRQPVGDRGERHDADPGRELRHRRPGRRLQRQRRREQRRAVPHDRGRRHPGHDGHGRRLQRGLDQRGRVARAHRERRGRGNLQPQAARGTAAHRHLDGQGPLRRRRQDRQPHGSLDRRLADVDGPQPDGREPLGRTAVHADLDDRRELQRQLDRDHGGAGEPDADGHEGGHRERHRHVFARGHQLRQRLQRELRERDERHADRRRRPPARRSPAGAAPARAPEAAP